MNIQIKCIKKKKKAVVNTLKNAFKGKKFVKLKNQLTSLNGRNYIPTLMVKKI